MSPRRRGRPRKSIPESAELEIIVESITSPGRRGRPRKTYPEVVEQETKPEEAIESITSPGRRGRPRKTYPEVVEQETKPEEAIESITSPGRRGRPRKTYPEAVEQETKPEEAMGNGPLVCERTVNIKKNEFEGFKESGNEDDFEFLESKLCFSVSQPISLHGIKFAAELHQNPKDVEQCPREKSDFYYEEAFITLLDGLKEIASTRCDDEVKYKSIVETKFENPVLLEKNKKYSVRVLCNVDGAYPMAVCSKSEVKSGVTFNFFPQKSNRDGIIRGFIFNKV